jgi:hypothetical protein
MHTVDTMKEIVNLRVHIAPVGFELDRIIIPAVKMKADKVWLVVHDNVTEDKSNKYRQKIEKALEKKGIKTEIAHANRLRLFPIIKAVTGIIFKERKNDIYVNVATGSKIHAIGCMMACMLFDDRDKIHPFYAQAEKYPEYEGSKQQTYGVAEIHTLPTYRIGTPKRELLEAMKIIKDAGGRIQKKKMAEEAEKSQIITVNAKKQNFTQARFASLDKNIVQPLVDVWGFVEVEKIGRNRWLKMTEDGNHAAEFLI